jgi:ABC-2 type transport system permease protein
MIGMLGRQIDYQLRLLARNPRGLWVSLLAPGLIMALRLGPGGSHAGSLAARAAVIAGLAAFGLIATCYLTHAIGLVTARESGVLRRWRASPLPRWGYFTGRITATVLLSLVAGAVIIAVGVSLGHVPFAAGSVPALLLVFVLGGVAWAALGTAVTALVAGPESANPVLVFSYLPVILLSGALGAIGEPAWLGTLMSYLPGRPVIAAASSALTWSGPGLAPVSGRDLAVLAGWALIGLLASVRFFRWAPVRPARAARDQDLGSAAAGAPGPGVQRDVESGGPGEPPGQVGAGRLGVGGDGGRVGGDDPALGAEQEPVVVLGHRPGRPGSFGAIDH